MNGSPNKFKRGSPQTQSSTEQQKLVTSVPEADKCKPCGERRWLQQGLTRELSRTHESKDQKHGESEQVLSSGRELRWSFQPDCYWTIRLQAERVLCSLCRPDESVVLCSSSSVTGASYISFLLCIKKTLRNGVEISEQLFWFSCSW